jgi:hypothetical protein
MKKPQNDKRPVPGPNLEFFYGLFNGVIICALIWALIWLVWRMV